MNNLKLFKYYSEREFLPLNEDMSNFYIICPSHKHCMSQFAVKHNNKKKNKEKTKLKPKAKHLARQKHRIFE